MTEVPTPSTRKAWRRFNGDWTRLGRRWRYIVRTGAAQFAFSDRGAAARYYDRAAVATGFAQWIDRFPKVRSPRRQTVARVRLTTGPAAAILKRLGS